VRLPGGLFYELDIKAARAGAHRLFRILDKHPWFGRQQGLDWTFCQPARHCRNRLLPVHHAVRRRWNFATGLSRDPLLVRARRAHQGFVVMSGLFPAGAARGASFAGRVRHAIDRGPKS
jgi:glutathione S-transferase